MYLEQKSNSDGKLAAVTRFQAKQTSSISNTFYATTHH